MGYESYGSGYFTWRNPLTPIQIDAFTESVKKTFGKIDPDTEGITLSFSECRMYWEDAQKDFAEVLKYCNGEFTISGDNSDDHWKLIFKDGKVSKASGYIAYHDPKETNLKTALGW